jgi:hypothetical protein
MSQEPLDIGHGHTLSFYRWAPDRDLNPQYDGLADLDPAGAFINHPRMDGTGDCAGAVDFDVPQEYKDRWGKWGNRHAYWTVESLEPLTISPSVLCVTCGDHGFIREGRWIPA